MLNQRKMSLIKIRYKVIELRSGLYGKLYKRPAILIEVIFVRMLRN